MNSEAMSRFDCFGGSCAVLVMSGAAAGRGREAVARARRRMLEWHDQFSRFTPDSELSLLNADPRETVPVSAVMARLVQSALDAARRTGGLVDPTLLGALESAGYRLPRRAPGAPAPIALRDALALAGERRPATPHPAARWREVSVDARGRTVTRPPGLGLDAGGIAKGLFGDILASALGGHACFAVDAAGDVRFGGHAALERAVQVANPFDEDALIHTFTLRHGAAATSGIGRRVWAQVQDGDAGHPPRPTLRAAHHLLDPATGRPAFTGLVQVTALAPTGVQAEVRAKAALLSGPAHAAAWLPDGGVIVADDGQATVLAASDQLSGGPQALAA
jgi:thiamine biosynthesis lipoprotein